MILSFYFLFAYGCNMGGYSMEADKDSGGQSAVAWTLTIVWIPPYSYEFRDEQKQKTAKFSKKIDLFKYLEQKTFNGKGILELSKIFQTLSDEEKRGEVEEMVKHLKRYGYHLIGVRLHSSTRSHLKIHKYQELPFMK